MLVLIITSIILIGIPFLALLFGSIFNASLIYSQQQNKTNLYEIPRCPPGVCSIKPSTGNKRCPINNQELLIDKDEICVSSEGLCKGTFKYPIKSNLGTNSSNSCDSLGCSCSISSICPQYITQTLLSKNSNVFSPLTTQSDLFIWNNEDDKSFYTPGNPISIGEDNIGIEFCTITTNWLNRITPGCTFSKLMTNKDIIKCLQIQNENEYKICSIGSLAIITDDYSSINSSNIMNNQVGCVLGNSCENKKEIPIYDVTYGAILCKKI